MQGPQQSLLMFFFSFASRELIPNSEIKTLYAIKFDAVILPASDTLKPIAGTVVIADTPFELPLFLTLNAIYIYIIYIF